MQDAAAEQTLVSVVAAGIGPAVELGRADVAAVRTVFRCVNGQAPSVLEVQHSLAEQGGTGDILVAPGETG